MTKVNNLIEKLVDENEILANGLLSNNLEVGLEGLNDPVEQLEGESSINVMPCNGNDKEVTLHDMTESRTTHSPYGCTNLLVVQNVIFERGCDNTTVILSQASTSRE